MASIDYLHRVPHGDLASTSVECERSAVGRAVQRVLYVLVLAAIGIGLLALRYWVYAPPALHSGS
jgi:hypothetical protein